MSLETWDAIVEDTPLAPLPPATKSLYATIAQKIHAHPIPFPASQPCTMSGVVGSYSMPGPIFFLHKWKVLLRNYPTDGLCLTGGVRILGTGGTPVDGQLMTNLFITSEFVASFSETMVSWAIDKLTQTLIAGAFAQQYKTKATLYGESPLKPLKKKPSIPTGLRVIDGILMGGE